MSVKRRARGFSAQDWVFAALFLCAVILACWKCPYGMGGDDETFYLSIPHRLVMGDALIRHEWNASQLSGFLLLPFVGVFRAFTGSMEGIVLAARYHYVLLHGVAAVFVYGRLKKYGPASIPAVLAFFLFTPLLLMTLSYNTMGLDLVVLTGVVMATSDLSRWRGPAAAGLCFAGAVLCCPYLLAVYLLYALAAAAVCVLKRTPSPRFILRDEELFSPHVFLRFTAGAAALAAVLLAFLLSRGGLEDLFDDIPYILNDPDHPSRNFFLNLLKYFRDTVNCHPCHTVSVFMYAAMVLVMFLDKRRMDRRGVYLLFSTGLALVNYLAFAPEVVQKYYSAIMFPMIYPGFTAWCLCEKRPPRLFPCLFVLGGLYSVAISFGSNNQFYAISAAFSVSNMASFLFLGQLFGELWRSGNSIPGKKALVRAGCVLTAAALVPFGPLLIETKVLSCYWDETTFALNCRIQGGPAKGIYTTQENQVTYDTLHRDLQYYAGKEPGNILIAGDKIVCYLDADMPYGTFSAWTYGTWFHGSYEFQLDKLTAYYRLSPEKWPRYIYIPKDTSWDISNLAQDAETWGYTIQESDLSYKLERVNAP